MAVAFSYSTWSGQYPTLAESVLPAQAAGYWAQATLYLDPSDASPVRDETARATILNLITAHLAILQAPDRLGMAGRISSASEGSVSVSTDAAGIPGSAVWWAQTGPGYAAWQALAPYRTMRYFAPGMCAGRRW